MPVIVGLWNPEAKYAGTRHNIGAEVLDVLAYRWGLTFKKGPMRVRAQIARRPGGDDAAVLARPLAFMNVSGPSVASVLKYYKTEPEDLLVIQDVIDLPFAKLRLRQSGGLGGHNGIKSVAQSLGTRDFYRLKIGVGRPPGQMDPAAYVLKRFSKSEQAEVDILVHDATDVAEQWLVDREAATRMAGERSPD